MGNVWWQTTEMFIQEKADQNVDIIEKVRSNFVRVKVLEVFSKLPPPGFQIGAVLGFTAALHFKS